MKTAFTLAVVASSWGGWSIYNKNETTDNDMLFANVDALSGGENQNPLPDNEILHGYRLSMENCVVTTDNGVKYGYCYKCVQSYIADNCDMHQESSCITD